MHVFREDLSGNQYKQKFKVLYVKKTLDISTQFRLSLLNLEGTQKYLRSHKVEEAPRNWKDALRSGNLERLRPLSRTKDGRLLRNGTGQSGSGLFAEMQTKLNVEIRKAGGADRKVIWGSSLF
jgi:hypothetical protein